MAAAFQKSGMGYGHYEDYGKYRLLDRIDDLKIRIGEIMDSDGDVRREYLADSDLKYCLPEHIKTLKGAERALHIAKKELDQKHGILILEGDELTDAESAIRKALGLPEITKHAFGELDPAA